MIKIDPKIFKAYDIRGIYPEQINAEIVYKIAQAYAELIKPKIVAVGCDMRLSGQQFKKAITKGLTDAGVNVIDIGLVSTDTLYFAVPFLNLDGGLMATASHNPKEYGGIKMVRAKGYPISGDSGINEIKNLVISNYQSPIVNKKGEVSKKDVTGDYINHVLKTFDLKKLKNFKIVANANFGMANIALGYLEKRLPIQLVHIINGQVDGEFPKGPPDPLLHANREETIEAVKKFKPDLGVSWDGDADRIFFFDEKGDYVRPPYISALLAKYYLKKFPEAKILHDTRIVRVIDKTVEASGGISIMNKAGHSFIKETMIKKDVVFGCETSGHYFFKDNYYLDNGIMPFLAVLEILSKSGKPFSEVLRPFREMYATSEEINMAFTNKNVLEDLSKHFLDAKIDQVDGYDFNYPDWRFNIRLSNTEPVLRINLEADSEELLKKKTEEVTELVNKIK